MREKPLTVGAYLAEVVRKAWSESLDVAQAVVFVSLIAVGALTSVFPKFAEAHSFPDLLNSIVSWEGAALVLAAVVASRIIVAPFNITKKDRFSISEKENILNELAIERTLDFVELGMNVQQISNQLAYITVKLTFINSGDKLLVYEFKKINAEVNGIKSKEVAVPTAKTHIPGHGKRTYSFATFENVPLTWPITTIFEYHMEYDNLPAIKKRTSIRRIKQMFVSQNPLVYYDEVQLEKEL